MAEQNAVATQQGTQLSVAAQVKSMISQDAVKKKFTEVLGQKAPQFLASITNVVAGSAQLKKCPATTIMSAAFVAATYDLPIDSNLGFAAIVPYNNNKYNQQTRQWEKHPEAQFQMMYKGFIQLAIRSGYYEKMNCSVVYKDELVSYNPITGEVEFVTDFSKCTQRAEGKSENIAGYYAWFKLLTGFRKELFMTTAEVENHARKYSTAYRYDLENNKKGSKWTTDFEAMALKTVIKMLLSKWGILSVDMQRAIQDDQKVYDEDGDGSYGDNQPDFSLRPVSLKKPPATFLFTGAKSSASMMTMPFQSPKYRYFILAPCHTPMTINVMTLAMQPGSTLLICAPNLGFSHLPKFRKRFEIESG